MKKELNKELEPSKESIETLIEELSSREEMFCKGDINPISTCKIN